MLYRLQLSLQKDVEEFGNNFDIGDSHKNLILQENQKTIFRDDNGNITRSIFWNF